MKDLQIGVRGLLKQLKDCNRHKATGANEISARPDRLECSIMQTSLQPHSQSRTNFTMDQSSQEKYPRKVLEESLNVTDIQEKG